MAGNTSSTREVSREKHICPTLLVDVTIGKRIGRSTYRAVWNRLKVTAVRLEGRGSHPLKIYQPDHPHINILTCHGYFLAQRQDVKKKITVCFYIFEYFDEHLSDSRFKFIDTDGDNIMTINLDCRFVYDGLIGCIKKLWSENITHGHIIPYNVALTYGFDKRRIESVKLMGIVGESTNDADLLDDFYGIGRIVECMFGGRHNHPRRYPEAMDLLRRFSKKDPALYVAYSRDPELTKRHALFWYVPKGCLFLYGVSSVLTSCEQERIAEAKSKGGYNDPNKPGAIFTYSINQIPVKNWKAEFPADIKNDKHHKSRDSLGSGDLTVTVRNRSSHSLDSPLDYQQYFGRNPDLLYSYFRKRNPHLLMAEYLAVEAHMKRHGGFPFTKIDCFDYFLISPCAGWTTLHETLS